MASVIMVRVEVWFELTCKSFIRRASDSYERPLKPGEKIRQVIHRFMCRICRLQERRMHQLHALAHELGQASPDEGDARLSPDTVERIRRAMKKADPR